MTVTKQQQLEWLAKEFAIWPGFRGIAIHMSNIAIGMSGDGHAITREEWQQERDKMQKQGEKADSWHERGELPPIGCECEVLNNDLYNPAWEKCTIIFMGQYKCIYSSETRSEIVGNIDLTGAIEFRPLRTEREKAIDEMIAAIDHIKEGNFQTFIGALYDSGYRKVNP